MPRSPKPPVAHPQPAARTSSASRCATTRARCPRCAPAAATTRSPPRIVRAFYELDTPPHMIAKLSRHRLLVEDADLLRRAARTASTRRTGACRPSRPAPTPPTASSPTSASRATATRCRSASASCATPSAATSNMLYVIENNGVYGLTKGQFSASADVGSKSKRGEANRAAPIDPVLLALEPRRDVRRAQLLGRQGAARADPQGGAARTRASR